MTRLIGRSVIFDDMCWPAVTGEVAELSWRLRHGRECLTESDLLTAASIVDAYMQMVSDPRKKREHVCRQIRLASRNTESHE